MDQEYTQLINKIDVELKRWLPIEPDGVWAEKVFGSFGKKTDTEALKFLISPLRELVFRGGKRWRPLLMILVYEALGGENTANSDNAVSIVNPAIALSPIVEFSHSASLIHDDIEDGSDERRGKPAVHKIFGIDAAINAI